MASTVLTSTLQFGMVSAPCRLQKAADKRATALKMCSPAGNAVEQRYVDTETGEIFAPAECQKAAVAADGSLFLIDKETVKAIDESCKIDSLTIDGFIPVDEIPLERSESCYFVAPPKGAAPAQVKPLALLAAGLKQTGKAGHGKLTLRTQQRAFVVYEKDGGLLLNTLAFADEFIAPAEAGEQLASVAVDEKTVGLAATLIEALAAEPGALDAYTDEAKPKKSALIEAVLAGEQVTAPTAAAPVAKTDDLEALLLASIGGSPAAAAPKKKAAAKAASKAAA
jgi:DNA end-binding protein Ku